MWQQCTIELNSSEKIFKAERRQKSLSHFGRKKSAAFAGLAGHLNNRLSDILGPIQKSLHNAMRLPCSPHLIQIAYTEWSTARLRSEKNIQTDSLTLNAISARVRFSFFRLPL